MNGQEELHKTQSVGPNSAHWVCRDNNFPNRTAENTPKSAVLCAQDLRPLYGADPKLCLPMQTMKSRHFTQALCQVLCTRLH